MKHFADTVANAQVDRNEDMLRSCLRAVEAISRIPGVNACEPWRNFMQARDHAIVLLQRRRHCHSSAWGRESACQYQPKHSTAPSSATTRHVRSPQQRCPGFRPEQLSWQILDAAHVSITSIDRLWLRCARRRRSRRQLQCRRGTRQSCRSDKRRTAWKPWTFDFAASRRLAMHMLAESADHCVVIGGLSRVTVALRSPSH